MMTGHISSELWSDYVDASLNADDQRAIDAHLAGCVACADELRRLRAVAKALQSLEGSTAPESDLWPVIAARLQVRPRGVTSGSSAMPPPPRLSFRLTLPQLGAAALALVILGAGVGRWILPRPVAPVAMSQDAPDTRSAGPQDSGPWHRAVEVQRAGSDYVGAVAALRRNVPLDSPTAQQGREAAVAALLGAATELNRMSPADPSMQGVLRSVSAARALASGGAAGLNSRDRGDGLAEE